MTAQEPLSPTLSPLRIASLDLPVPFAPELEAAFRPTRDKVIEQITGWIG